MPTYRVQAKFDSCELRFKLKEPDVITPPLVKKLNAMGFPNMWGKPSATKLNTASNGVVSVITDSLDLPEPFPIIRPTEEGRFECLYSPEDNTIVVKLDGTFESCLTEDVKSIKNAACLYIAGITLQDTKGKDIKGPKDEYGMACRLEANVTGSYKEPEQSYQVPVTITLIKE